MVHYLFSPRLPGPLCPGSRVDFYTSLFLHAARYQHLFFHLVVISNIHNARGNVIVHAASLSVLEMKH